MEVDNEVASGGGCHSHDGKYNRAAPRLTSSGQSERESFMASLVFQPGHLGGGVEPHAAP